MKKLTRVQKKIKYRRIFLRFFLFILICFLIIRLAKESSYFNIKEITIYGNNKVTSKEILKVSNIKKGVNLFNINTCKSNKDLKKLVYIKDIKIKRRIPNKLTIDVEERKELFQVKDKTKYIILDKDELVLRISNNRIKDLAVVDGIKINNSVNKEEVGSLFEKHILEKDQKDFLKQLIDLNLLYNIEYINLKDRKNIEIITKNNKLVEFGNISNFKYKLEMLNEILNYIKDNKIEYSKVIMDKGDDPIIVTEKVGG